MVKMAYLKMAYKFYTYFTTIFFIMKSVTTVGTKNKSDLEMYSG